MALVDDYENAVRTGDTSTANYLAKMLAYQAGINIATNDVEAAPASLLPKLPSLSPGGAASSNATPSAGDISFSSVGDALLQGILHPLDTLAGNNTTQMNSDIASGNGPLTASTKSISGALSFITDIPRVTTTLLGLIVLIAGIFALTRGQAVTIVSNAVHTAATS